MSYLLAINGHQKEVDALLFDLDGTLVSTSACYRETVVRQISEELGLPYKQNTADAFWFGKNRNGYLEAQMGREMAQAFWTCFNRLDQPGRRAAATTVYPDVGIVLPKLPVPLGIVTACPREKMREYPLNYGMFGAVVIAHEHEFILPKPDPEGLYKCAEQLGVLPERCAYVGNGEEDIIAARAARMLDILIERGEVQVEEEPTLRITTLEDLLSRSA